MIAVIYAHPYPHVSRACAALVKAISGVPGLTVRSLYDLYPDFDIDHDAERSALEGARLVVFVHPIYWYSMPALLKHWFDQVLAKGWAYAGGQALAGKDCLWVATSSGDERDFVPAECQGHPFEAFVPVVERTARFCGMKWLEPFIVPAASRVADAELAAAAQTLRKRLDAWTAAAERAGA